MGQLPYRGEHFAARQALRLGSGDQRLQVALQRVDARIAMHPRIAQVLGIERQQLLLPSTVPTPSRRSSASFMGA